MTHYAKAPITEALIDIRVQAAERTMEELAAIQAPERDRYPTQKKLYSAAIELGAKEPGEMPSWTSQSSAQRGWAFVAQNKLQVWQVHRDGFTFSRLAPYESWEPFRNEARRLWQLTRPTLDPKSITRAAVRYINRIELPSNLRDFKDYLRTVPEVSPALSQGLLSFFMQIQIPQPDINGLLILTQTLLPPAMPEPSVGVLLDMDLIRADDLPVDDEGLWGFFEQLHTRKNEIFEGCITDMTRELIS